MFQCSQSVPTDNMSNEQKEEIELRAGYKWTVYMLSFVSLATRALLPIRNHHAYINIFSFHRIFHPGIPVQTWFEPHRLNGSRFSSVAATIQQQQKQQQQHRLRLCVVCACVEYEMRFEIVETKIDFHVPLCLILHPPMRLCTPCMRINLAGLHDAWLSTETYRNLMWRLCLTHRHVQCIEIWYYIRRITHAHTHANTWDVEGGGGGGMWEIFSHFRWW